MRILHVIPSMSAAWGGPVSVVAGLVESLAALSVESEIFTTDLGRTHDVVKTGAVHSETVRTSWLSRFWTGHGFSTASALDTAVQRCDVVHIHELWHHPHFQAQRAARRHGRPFVISPHGELDPWALRHKRWKKSVYMALAQKRVLRRASVVHALTVEEARQVALFAPSTPCNIVPNGIDESAFDSMPQDVDLFPSMTGKKVVLFLGRLHEKKGLDILAGAISMVRKTHPDVGLLIAGDSMDGYRDQVEKFVDAAGIGDITVFAGHLEGNAVREALAVARIFALPSRSEGFPMAVLEALAAGVPAVITPECFFPEMAEAEAGIEVEGTVASFTKAINEILANEKALNKMSENARHLVKTSFARNDVAAKMIALYEEICTK